MDNRENLLDEMLRCNIACADFNGFHFEKPKAPLERIDYYLKVLPSANYILDQQTNYIFSNSITTGRVDGDAALNNFLYRQNMQGVTNYSVLQDCIKRAIAYGECGIRWYEDSIYLVTAGTFATLTYTDEGIERVVGYVTTEEGESIGDSTIDLEDFEFDGDITQSLLRDFKSRKWIFLDTSEFINIRNDTSKLHGSSPFLTDEVRLELLVTAYKGLLHDLKYDGTGRIVLFPKSGLISDDYNEISTSTVLKSGITATAQREEKARLEVKEIAKQIKESGSDSIILLSDAFSENITHLPRVVTATEFFDWLKDERKIVSEVVGMIPDLLGFGDMSGNVSMEKIIDNAMLNTIIPLREKYAVQFSSFISEHIGVEKVYFDKYELQQAEDENSMRTKIVNIMSVLNSIGTEKTDALVSDFADMLDSNIHHENRELKELKVQKRRDDNDKHEGNTKQGK